MRIKLAVVLLAAAFGVAALGQGPRRDVGKNLPPAPAPAPAAQAAPTASARGQAPAIPIDANLVTFNVIVENKGEIAIRGLKKSDFTVFEDGVEQQITHFAPTDAPLTIAVAIEYSQVTYSVENMRAQAAAIFDSLGPEDWGALISYDVNPKIVVDFTRSKGELNAGLQLLDRPVYRESAIFDVVYDALDRLENIDGRKALFILGTGFDTVSQHTLSQVLRKAEASDTMVYAVSIGQLTRIRLEGNGRIGFGNSIDYLAADNNMRQFAEATGGAAFFPRTAQEFNAIYARVNHELHSQYSLGYVAKNTKTDGKFRKLRVDIAKMDLDHDGKDDGLKARNKKGYYAPKK